MNDTRHLPDGGTVTRHRAGVATVNIPGVELVKAGKWNSARGEVTITPADLAAMVTESRDPDVDAAPLKLGHVDPRFDGEPALGWVRNLRLSTDGGTLIGDLTEVPASLADVLGSAYPRRSVEVAWGLPGKKGARGAVLTGLALLGVTSPAVKGLQDVYRAAASGQDATVTFTLSSDTADLPPITPQPSDDRPYTDMEGTMQDKNETAKAPEADVEAAEKPDDVTPEVAEVTPDEATDKPEVEAVAAAAPATVTLSQGQYDELLRGATAGQAALAALDQTRRDGIITAALNEGRLRPSDQKAWRTALDRDEDSTVALLGTLPQQTVPTASLGSAHATFDPSEAAWDEFSKSLTGKDA